MNDERNENQRQRPLWFAPFHTSGPEGTNLGLWVAQLILMTHRGDIELTQTSEQGTTFTLELLPAIEAPTTNDSRLEGVF